MATKTNCVCGKTINRTLSVRSKKARKGRGSGKVRRYIGTTHQLCSPCMVEFIRSRSSYDDPNEPGTHTLCDFCNDKTKNSFLKIFTKPTIFRWQGTVSKYGNGQSQTVCSECRTELKEFIKNKREENQTEN